MGNHPVPFDWRQDVIDYPAIDPAYAPIWSRGWDGGPSEEECSTTPIPVITLGSDGDDPFLFVLGVVAMVLLLLGILLAFV